MDPNREHRRLHGYGRDANRQQSGPGFGAHDEPQQRKEQAQFGSRHARPALYGWGWKGNAREDTYQTGEMERSVLFEALKSTQFERNEVWKEWLSTLPSEALTQEITKMVAVLTANGDMWRPASEGFVLYKWMEEMLARKKRLLTFQAAQLPDVATHLRY